MSNDITTTTHSLLPVKLPPVSPVRILVDQEEFDGWENRMGKIVNTYHHVDADSRTEVYTELVQVLGDWNVFSVSDAYRSKVKHLELAETKMAPEDILVLANLWVKGTPKHGVDADAYLQLLVHMFVDEEISVGGFMLAFRTLMERKPAKPGEYPNLPSHGELLDIFRKAESTVMQLQHSIRNVIPLYVTRLLDYKEQYPEECVKNEQHERKLRQQREVAEKSEKIKEATKELKHAQDQYEGLKLWAEDSIDEYKVNPKYIDVRDEKIAVINEVLEKHRQKIAAVVNKYREAGVDLD